MASHTNNSGYSSEGNEGNDIATPFNRPKPLYEMRSSTPVDPTAALLAEGGSLALNDRDRAALSAWFHTSFEGHFEGGLQKWFQQGFTNFLTPVRERINKNFETVFHDLQKNEEEIVKLRGTHAAEVAKLRGEVAGLRKACDATETFINGMAELIDKNNKEIAGLRENMTAEIIKMHKQFANEVVKIHATTRHEMRDFISGKNKEFRDQLSEMRGKTTSRLSGEMASMKEDLLAALRAELTGELIKMQKSIKAAAKPVPKSASKLTSGRAKK